MAVSVWLKYLSEPIPFHINENCHVGKFNISLYVGNFVKSDLFQENIMKM